MAKTEERWHPENWLCNIDLGEDLPKHLHIKVPDCSNMFRGCSVLPKHLDMKVRKR